MSLLGNIQRFHTIKITIAVIVAVLHGGGHISIFNATFSLDHFRANEQEIVPTHNDHFLFDDDEASIDYVLFFFFYLFT